MEDLSDGSSHAAILHFPPLNWKKEQFLKIRFKGEFLWDPGRTMLKMSMLSGSSPHPQSKKRKVNKNVSPLEVKEKQNF